MPSCTIVSIVNMHVADKEYGKAVLYAGWVQVAKGITSSNASDFTLQQVIDLGNAILGGDGTFPNGPDVLSVAVRILDTTTVSATNPFKASGRITWSESQA